MDELAETVAILTGASGATREDRSRRRHSAVVPNQPQPKSTVVAVTSRRRLLLGAGAASVLSVLHSRGTAAAAIAPQPDVAAASLNNGLAVAARATGPALIRVHAWPKGQPQAKRTTTWQSTNRSNAIKVTFPGVPAPGVAWSYQAEVAPPGSIH